MGENRCFRCGCKLVIDSDFKGSEIGLVSEDKAFT